jgi:protein-disulfide isomerase
MDLDPPLSPDDHVAGSPDAPLELVMFADFQCPYCNAAQSGVSRVRGRLGGRVKFAFRHLPMRELHPNAQRAAEASEAAAAQGKFWEMHDALYARRGQLGDDALLACAAEIGIDAERLRSELESGAHADRVARDVESARLSGVAGTPAFFANGTRVGGAFDAGSLIEALERRGD